jgi:allophanate hydrolase subunit 2
VAGGFDAPIILGSRSALEPLKAGEVLICPPSSTVTRRSLPFLSFDDSAESVLRAVDGLQREWFADDAFFGEEYQVSPASNRMGIRLTGRPLTRRPGELVSEAVAPGAVQVTNDGLPVVLGIDGQTIGGYPKVAHVIRADLDKLAQLRPGSTVRFERVTLAQAEAAARDRAQRLRQWRTRLTV